MDEKSEAVVDYVKPLDEFESAELGHLANSEDHDLTKWEAWKTQRGAVLWSIFCVWTITLVAYDNSAGGSYLSIPKFREDFGKYYEGSYVLNASWQSAFSGSAVATSIIGALSSASISDAIGRKYAIMGSLVISYAAITLEMVATTNPMFFGAELLNGLSIGNLATVCITYIGEVAPLPLRGVLNCLVAMAWTAAPFGTSIILQFVGNLETRWAYRSLFCSQYVIAFFATVFVPFMPESPWWFATKGKDEKALRSLRKLGFKNGNEFKRLAYIKLTLEEVRRETEGVTYFECFRKSNLRRTIISIAPLSIQALSGVSWMAGYSTYYMELAGYSTYASFTLLVIINVVSIIGNVMSWYLIDRVGRRDLQFWGLFGLTLMLLIAGGLATQTENIGMIKGVVALIMLYNWWYGVTIGSTAYVLLCEIATSRLRTKTIAIGLALQNGIYLMWAFVLPYMFNPNEANMGAKVAFVFGGLCVISLVYLHYYQPETTDRTYEELDELFMKRIPVRDFKHYKTDAEKQSEAAKVAQALDQVTETHPNPSNPGQKDDPVLLKINGNLQIRGIISKVGGNENFLGINYARFPERFRSSKLTELESQTGIIDATQYGPRCPQPADHGREQRKHLFEGIRPSTVSPTSEFDCLNLNIYTPPPGSASSKSATETGLLPVFVWIHGGGFTLGDGGSDFDGNYVVQRSVELGKPFIYVAINYRLGYYGFLSSAELEHEAQVNGEEYFANKGLYDQRVALQWVQKYIHHFGGDASNITIAGESAGGLSVLAHILSDVPICKRGIVMSCPVWSFPDHPNPQTTFDSTLSKSGISPTSDDKDKLAALRKLTSTQMETLLEGKFVDMIWDNKWFVHHDEATLLEHAKGLPNWVEGMIVGWTKDEIAISGIGHTWTTKEQIQKATLQLFNGDDKLAQEVMDTYGINNTNSDLGTALRNFYAFISDGIFGILPQTLAETNSSSPLPISLYRFDQPDTFDISPFKGYAYHTLDTAFSTLLPAVAGPTAPKEMQQTSSHMARAFTDFIVDGKQWDTFSKSGGKIMVFNGEEDEQLMDLSTEQSRWKRFVSAINDDDGDRARKFKAAFKGLANINV